MYVYATHEVNLLSLIFLPCPRAEQCCTCQLEVVQTTGTDKLPHISLCNNTGMENILYI